MPSIAGACSTPSYGDFPAPIVTPIPTSVPKITTSFVKSSATVLTTTKKVVSTSSSTKKSTSKAPVKTG